MSGEWYGWHRDDDGNLVRDEMGLPSDVVHWSAICTGRGRHTVRKLGDLLDRRLMETGDVLLFKTGFVANPPVEGEPRKGRAVTRALRWADIARSGHRGGTLTMPACGDPACISRPRVSQARISDALDKLAKLEPGRRVVDMSYLG